jgi:hypothetical protein
MEYGKKKGGTEHWLHKGMVMLELNAQQELTRPCYQTYCEFQGPK